MLVLVVIPIRLPFIIETDLKKDIPLLTKDEVANIILDEILKLKIKSDWNAKILPRNLLPKRHPDKICDQISDAVLDAILEKGSLR